MRMYDLIDKKKRGGTLTEEEIRFFVKGTTDGSIPDYQLTAFLMAVCLQGMDKMETAILTDAMARSGDRLDLSRFGTNSVDKHSTGGVGDKTTLIVTPIAAALGCAVAKMSGRGLGYTGGTADKLGSIPGYRLTMPHEEFMKQVETAGAAVISQSGNLAPADKKLYALRDVTATVDSLPLIASSIMSKKIAAGAHSIVLDVKVGSGAFMKTKEDAAALARAMVDIGTACGRRVTAVLTNMDIPLGIGVGNTLEVLESVQVLKGGGPEDLKAVSLELAAHMVSLAKGISVTEARRLAEDTLRSGAALQKFRQWIGTQSGDTAFIDDPSAFSRAKVIRPVTASRDGYITAMNTEAIGETSVVLGAGRARAEDEIDPSAGIEILKKTGDRVEKGEPIAILHTADEEKWAEGDVRYSAAVTVGDIKPPEQKLIYGVIGEEA